MDYKDEPKAISRRAFLDYSIRGIGAFITALLAVPIIGYVVSPVFAKKEAQWVEVGLVDDFKVGEPRSVEFTQFRKDGWVEVSEKKTVWIVRQQGENQFTVFNPRCTHLGCAYSWDAQKQNFLCPCHNGFFDITGKVVGGPPPRGLDKLEFKVEGNRLACIYRDFLLGTTEQSR